MQPIRMSEDEKSILKKESLTYEPIVVLNKPYYLKEYRAEGLKSVVWKGVDDFNGSPVAIKFSTRRDYYDQVYLAEVKKAAKLNQYAQFAKYLGAEEKIIEGIECVVFVEEWIEGTTLKNFKEITASFIESYIKQFCIVLNILKINNLRHDDLNLGNVVIAEPLPGDYRNEYSIKVIDMGSLKDYDSSLKKSKLGFDDLKRFCIHLIELSNRLLFENNIRRPISRKEKLYRLVIKKILPQILEEDNNISLHDPEKIQEVLLNEFAMSLKNQEENISSIDTPFDYISADHIGSDVLLNELFATSCPWLSEVKNNTPVLLTGPRGCGKSMIFRWL